MSDSGMLVFEGYLCMPETPINNNIYIYNINNFLIQMTNNYIVNCKHITS